MQSDFLRIRYYDGMGPSTTPVAGHDLAVDRAWSLEDRSVFSLHVKPKTDEKIAATSVVGAAITSFGAIGRYMRPSSIATPDWSSITCV